MRSATTLWPLLAAACLAACAPTEGDGVEREDVLVLRGQDLVPLPSPPPLRGVSVRNGIRVEVTVTDTPSDPRLTIDDNLFDLIEGRVDADGFLDVRVAGDIDPMVPPVVRFSTTALEYISARDEDSSIQATGVAADRFGVAASEGGAIEVDGTCSELVLIASGSNATATDLACVNGTIDAQGGAIVSAQLSMSVRVTASGESRITVSGSPPDVSEALTDGSVLTIE